MMRDLAGKIEPTPPPSSTPVTVSLNDEAPKLNGSASMSSLPISKSALLLGQSQTLLDRAADEGLMILQSPKVRSKVKFFYFLKILALKVNIMQVGFFRRSRTIKGKRAPPSCKEVSSCWYFSKRKLHILIFQENRDGVNLYAYWCSRNK